MERQPPATGSCPAGLWARRLGQWLLDRLRAPLGGKVRRRYLTLFRKEYVRHQAARRRGECRQCGACCRLVWRCPFLTAENRCRIYGRTRHPNCVAFPIDDRDLRDVHGVCGHSFRPPPQEPQRNATP
jgi:hypothetical protein